MANDGTIEELNLEDIIGERFGRYSKYIIQERALPDIRDGLKPVQRRILYAMNLDGNTFDKGFRKSAKSVGLIMGNYHPHGDSSIYEAMVRMSQDWKLREVLIEMHGNNGSMDGDPAAAMRYTEARLSEVSGELLQDIEKNTVEMVWNFDDTEKEPTVLPARFPNLLVNGATGISAGYATEIPTHNLGEVIDATIYLLGHPNATVDKLMTLIPGPDFPTGGILQGQDAIKEAYTTGKGKAILRSKTAIESIKGGKEQIVVKEIPYEVNKANLVKKMDEIRILKRVDGIAEVRDESDRDGLRIVVELKKEANSQGILNYLLKNTDLQINYNFNMVAIDERHPRQVGLVRILTAYIEHRRQVIVKRSRFELEKAKQRQHIVEGLIKALSILDQVISIIRGSSDKKDAKNNLMTEFDFTELQAEAIVSLQLYRLTNTDITALEQEAKDLAERIARLEKIIANPDELDKVIKKELNEVKKKYATPRKTVIEKEIQEITIETKLLIADEDVLVTVTEEGYVKRTSQRSYAASLPEEYLMRDGDRLVFCETLSTLSHLLLITTKGNIIYRPVHELPEIRWKEMGEHLSQTITGLAIDENILKVIAYETMTPGNNIVLMTKQGMIKQVAMEEFSTWRTYRSKATSCMKLKSDEDVLINAFVAPSDSSLEIVIVTERGFALRFDLSEVPVVGAKAMGVKGINLKAEDTVVGGCVVNDAKSELLLLTQRGFGKKIRISDISKLSRSKRGLMVLRELKSKPHRVIFTAQIQDKNSDIVTVSELAGEQILNVDVFKLENRTSNGKQVLDEKVAGNILTANYAIVFPQK